MLRIPKVLLLAGVIPLSIAACDQPAAEPVSETVVAVAPPVETPVSWTGSWASELGDLLVVPADTDNTAIVLYPETPPAALLGAGRIVLIGAGGDTIATNVVAKAADSLECGGAPVVGFTGGPAGGWVVGLTSGVSVLRSDSIEAMPARDSARMVATLARLASTITANEETRFNGLPFAVIRARRFTAGNVRVVTAHLVRKVPHEASPLEEHTLVVAERPVTGDSLALRFSQRSEGNEETAEHFEVLSGVSTPTATLLLVVRDNVSGTTYQVLERSASGAWRVRWTRALRC